MIRIYFRVICRTLLDLEMLMRGLKPKNNEGSHLGLSGLPFLILRESQHRLILPDDANRGLFAVCKVPVAANLDIDYLKMRGLRNMFSLSTYECRPDFDRDGAWMAHG